jgi:peptidoglycan/LPS O-acetylase OafA/YrhL
MRWWQHPLTLVAWSVLVVIIYALFPSSDTAALIALLVWGVGLLAWMVAGDPDFGPDARAIWKDVRRG